MPSPEPAYLTIAAQLRADITAGTFTPGERLPSESQLMRRHDVSRSVAKWAFALLKADGWVVGRQGSGVYVKVCHRVARHPHVLHVDSTQPWAEHTEEIAASTDIAARLALRPGTPVTHTYGRYLPTGGPLQLVHAWRPVDHPHHLTVDRSQERVIIRPASPDELTTFGLTLRGTVIVISRYRLAGKIPVDVTDVIAPSDRLELVYELPL